MITDGYTAYVPIIEKLQMTHQKCVFHKIMNQRTPVWKTTNKLERQLKTKTHNQKPKTLTKMLQPFEKPKCTGNTNANANSEAKP